MVKMMYYFSISNTENTMMLCEYLIAVPIAIL